MLTVQWPSLWIDATEMRLVVLQAAGTNQISRAIPASAAQCVARICCQSVSKSAFINDEIASGATYLQSDPIGLYGGSWSTYSYTNSSPVGHSDRFGLQTAPAVPAGPLPIVIPPVAVPGTPENDRFVRAGLSAIEQIKDAARRAAEAIRNACSSSNDDSARCKQVYKYCANKCADTFADDPDGLPGTGRDYGARVRRCISECVKAAGCSPVQGP